MIVTTVVAVMGAAPCAFANDGGLVALEDDRRYATLHTPLGDDMCRIAPDLIMELCQTFVALRGV